MSQDLPASAVVHDATEAWGRPLLAAACPKCRVAHLVPPDRVGAPCPNCFSANLVEQPARLRPEPPELCVPFAAGDAAVTAALDRWARSVWLRPAELNGALLASRLTRTFIPMWLLDAEVTGAWQVQAGFDYEVASTQESYRDGQWATQRLTETRMRWEPRAGEVRRSYQNVDVPALEEHARLMGALGRWDTSAASPYAPAALQAAAVRVPSLDTQAAWPFARGRLDERVVRDCLTAAGAQHSEQEQLKLDYRSLHWTQMLLPLYTAAYRDDDGAWRTVFIHGQTARVAGVKQASQKQGWLWTGVLAAAALGLFVVSAALGFFGAMLPPLLVLAGVLLVVSIVVALAAPIPAVWAWRFNRRPTTGEDDEGQKAVGPRQ